MTNCSKQGGKEAKPQVVTERVRKCVKEKEGEWWEQPLAQTGGTLIHPWNYLVYISRCRAGLYLPGIYCLGVPYR